MKKIILFVLCFSTYLYAEPVRNLKAFDAITGAELTSEWQNKAQNIRFTWKEPLFEVPLYKYALGPTGKEPLQGSTETNACVVSLPKDGTYIFRVAPANTNGKTAEEQSFVIRLDTVAPDNTVAVTFNNNVLSFTTNEHSTGAPLKGILFYYGTNVNGQPDRFCTVTADVRPLIPRQGEPDYYVSAALEDMAGNISPVKLIATLNSTEPALTKGNSNMRVLGRTSDILNESKELVPGTRIHYRLNIINDGPDPAPMVELLDAVPIGTTLVANTSKASRPVRIEYFDTSLNNGAGAWTPVPLINSTQKIRWTFIEPIPASQTPESVEYIVEANKI